MPSIRIGFSSDFTLKNQLVGIGTDTADVKLEVVGVLKGDFNISGVTTLTSYAGFIPQKQSGDGVTLTTEVNTLSEDIIVGLGKTFTVSIGSTVNIGTLESVSIGTHFSVPNGGIESRTEDPIEGTVRFNDDLNTLEFYNGVEWRQFTVTGASGRGVFGGPFILDFINISSTGNAINFGTLSESRSQLAACSSSTRGLFAGGQAGPSFINTIDYITIQSEGNAIDFGDLHVGKRRMSDGGCSSSTRGLFAGGYTGTPTATSFNNIDYVTIATLGNAFDFGDLSVTRSFIGSVSSPTRGVFAGGFSQPSPTNIGWTIIEFVTISSTGNAIDFGDLLDLSYGKSGVSNGTRGIFAGGTNPSGIFFNTIEYITIATTGNSIYFGNLSVARTYPGSASSMVRGVWGGGNTPTDVNTMDYITINTAGNAQDFGYLTSARSTLSGCSDSHGGLGGF